MTDAELIECAQEFREGILNGQRSDMRCYMVCAPLVGYLGFLGVAGCKLAQAEGVSCTFGTTNHYWIELRDGRVLDPTADQFNDMGHDFPPVYLGEPKEVHRNGVVS